MSNTIPSRLAGKAGAPARGLGAGFAENQRLSGAMDPHAAAAEAALDPRDAAELQEAREKALSEIEDKKSELKHAAEEGVWTPPDTKVPIQVLLDRTDAGTIRSWHAAMVKIKEESVEDVGDQAESIAASFRVQPDDPLYDPLVDKVRRTRIESLLEPLGDEDFESLVFKGYIEQAVPVHSRLTVTLRSLTTQQGMWIEYYMYKQPETSRQYASHLLGIIQAAVAVQKINNQVLSPSLDHYKTQATRDEFFAALEKRIETLQGMSSVITDDFIIQNIWFSGRVRKLLAGNLVERVGKS